MGAGFTAAITECWSQIAEVVNTITGSGILMIPVAFVFAGGTIGLAKSLMGTRRRRR